MVGAAALLRRRGGRAVVAVSVGVAVAFRTSSLDRAKRLAETAAGSSLHPSRLRGADCSFDVFGEGSRGSGQGLAAVLRTLRAVVGGPTMPAGTGPPPAVRLLSPRWRLGVLSGVAATGTALRGESESGRTYLGTGPR